MINDSKFSRYYISQAIKPSKEISGGASEGTYSEYQKWAETEKTSNGQTICDHQGTYGDFVSSC